MYRGDAYFFARLDVLLRQQASLIGCLTRPSVNRVDKSHIRRFLNGLRALQASMWGSLAKRPRAQLLAAARQVDALVEHWERIASEVGVYPTGRAMAPPVGAMREIEQGPVAGPSALA